MDAVLGSLSATNNSYSLNFQASFKAVYNSDSLIIESTFEGSLSADASIVDISLGRKTQGITARELIEKINQLLKDKLPEGVESLKPEDYTPEATADRIVKSTTGFFELYQKQHPELSPEEALDSFYEQVKKGIQTGYDDAYATLQGLGAFEIDGVQAGVEQTRILIDEKLQAFYEQKREELGLSTNKKSNTNSTPTQTEILAQAGVQGLNVTA
jgi:Domain of unknown function (DUF5610)